MFNDYLNKFSAISESLGIWATSSIHAILIVGTLCSILAFVLIKLFSPLLKWFSIKLFNMFNMIMKYTLINLFVPVGGVANFYFSTFQRGLNTKILLQELNILEDKSKLLIYSFMCFIRFYFHCLVSLFFSISLIIFLNLYHLEYPKTSIFLVVLVIFSISRWVLAFVSVKIIKRESGFGEILDSVIKKKYCEDIDSEGKYKLKRDKIIDDCPKYIIGDPSLREEFKKRLSDLESVKKIIKSKPKVKPTRPPKS